MTTELRLFSACGGILNRTFYGRIKLATESGGVSGGYSPQEEAAQFLGRAAGEALGNALREAFFGSRTQEARRAQAEAAERERLRREAVEDERRARLLGEMIGVEEAPDLKLMTGDKAEELAPMTDDTPIVSKKRLKKKGNFAAGVWLSQHVWTAEDPAAAARAADDAFQAALGNEADVAVSSGALALPEPARRAEFDGLREEYLKAHTASMKDGDKLGDLEYQIQVADKLLAEKKADIEALVLKKRLEGELRRERGAAERRQAKANAAEQALRAIVTPNPGDDGKKVGRLDRQAGRRASGPVQLGAQGPCRIAWIEAYNRGHFGGEPSSGPAEFRL